MVFTDKMLEAQAALEDMGHEAFVSAFASHYAGKQQNTIEELALYHKKEKDAIREYWEIIRNCDAILVLNYDRKGIANYIGGNTLMEIGFAHVLFKKIYLLNPVPEIEFYKAEIEAVRPVILSGKLDAMRGAR